MKKIFLNIIKILIILLILIFIAAIIAAFTIDPNKYKGTISSLVEKHTNRELKINGNISLSIFPGISIAAKDIALSNPKGISGNALTSNNLKIKLELMPLIQKQVVIKGLELQDTKVYTDKNKTININKIDLKGKSEAGIIKLSPIYIQLGKSYHHLTAEIDTNKKPADIQLTSKSDNFELGSLLTHLGQKKSITGSTSYQLSLKSHGESADKFKRNATGSLKLNVNDGFFYGIDLEKTINTAIDAGINIYNTVKDSREISLENIIDKNLKSYDIKPKPTDKTHFDKLTATANIKNGIINNNDLNIIDPGYLINGAGHINILNNTINYSAVTKINKKIDAPDDKIRNLLLETPIEVQVTGPLDAPKIKPLLDKYLKSILKQLPKEALIKTLKDKALKKLFGEDSVPITKDSTNGSTPTNNTTDTNEKSKSDFIKDKVFDILQ